MDNSQLKDALIDFLNRSETEIIDFNEGLTAKQKNEKGSLRKWSARDTISHLVFWGNHFNSQINRARYREKVPHVGDYINQVNDGVFIEHMDKPFAETLANFNKSFRDSVEILKSFPADEINNKKKYEYLNDRTLLDNALGTLGWHVVHHISDFYYKNGQKEKAIAQQEIITMRLNVFPSWKANAIYNLACFFALNGEKDRAIKSLKNSFVDRPELIEWSKSDSDLDGLRDDADFKALYRKN